MKAKSYTTFAIALLFGLPLHGAVFNVTTTLDTAAPNSLRGAIIAANALGGKNTIFLRQGTYKLNGSSGLVITTGGLTIVGQHNTTIDASGLDGLGILDNPVFHILPTARVMLEKLVITGGVGYGGGGIDNEGTLELNNCSIDGNFSFGFGGGGIYNSGDLSMCNCNVSDNSGGYSYGNEFSKNGGGIYNSGNLVMDNCIVRNNSTMAGVDGNFGGILIGNYIPGIPGEDAGNGGGIYNAGNLLVNNSTITDNACGSGGNGSDGYGASAGNGGNGGSGGGIYSIGCLVVNWCMVENNSSGGGGKGGNSYDYMGTSSQQDGNGGNGGNGGGIFNASGSSQATLIRTAVSFNSVGSGGEPGNNGNHGLNGSGPNLFGNFGISGH